MGFIDDLLAAIGSIAGEIEQALLFILNFVVNVFIFIWKVLVFVAGFFKTLADDVGKLFGHIWNGFFKGILTSIFKGIVSFGKWLHTIFASVVKYLRVASKYIDRIYNHYVRPILKWIRVARTFLVLLKALHIKWAAKLDSVLGTIQNDIQRAFLTIKGYLNLLIDLANILADPTNLLRRPTALLSLMRIWHASIRMFTGLPPGFFLPSPSRAAPLGLGTLPLHFDPSDPIQNPPASYYLTLDSPVPSFEGIAPGDTIDDTAPDSIAPLDFFSSTLYPDPSCIDPVQCLNDATRSALGR